MKTRQGFVSNSSSSSFVIQKRLLTPYQISLVKRHIEIANRDFREDFYASESDQWSIHEMSDTIEGDTFMDNFDMRDFLLRIGVPEEAFEFDGENY